MLSIPAGDSCEPRDTLSRERVLRATIELADELGIDALTMRELGRRLGVEAASLYNHIDGKDDLLNGITELVVNEIDVPTAAVDWKEAMRIRALSARDVFSRHPWAGALIDSPERSGLAHLAYADNVLGTLLRAGFSPRDAANALLVLDSYIYGFERQRSRLAIGDDGDNTKAAEEALATIPPDAYPSLMQVAEDFASRPLDDMAVFDLGLGMILDGLEDLLSTELDDELDGRRP